MLGDKRTPAQNPDFDDFASVQAAQITDNHSFLFRNSPESWHGVKPLTCDEESYRRFFNVIFEFPEKSETVASSPFAKIKSLFQGSRTSPLS